MLDLVATVTGLKADELEIDNGSFNKKEDLEARTGIAAQNGGLELKKGICPGLSSHF
jgi:hypothetical protein